ncbi:MAG TPA: hypothetical protein VLX92_14280 [Kofleriaceae bacterium]|nr:hypothetical protein [Kofleriaceae bacterium]
MRVALVVVFATSVARAEPHHCVDERGAHLILDETLVGITNPLGVENQLQLYACWPLVETPGLLFDYTNVELGLYDNLSPIYVQQGAFVQVTPLSPLVVRAEVAGVQYWPLPIDGAGYYAVSGYRADFRDAALPAARGGSATGVEAGSSVTLQGALPLAPRLGLVASDTLNPEYWRLGDGAYWVNERRDVILARSDWLVKNTAALLVEVKRAPATLRAGVTDDFTAVPRAGYAANLVGGLATLDVRHPTPSLHEVSAFVRVGDYTAHAFRRGVSVFFGLSAVWERLRG